MRPGCRTGHRTIACVTSASPSLATSSCWLVNRVGEYGHLVLDAIVEPGGEAAAYEAKEEGGTPALRPRPKADDAGPVGNERQAHANEQGDEALGAFTRGSEWE